MLHARRRSLASMPVTSLTRAIRYWPVWMANRPVSRGADPSSVRSSALSMAAAEFEARRGPSSIGSNPKAATTRSGVSSSMRAPKLLAFVMRS